jgi:hypothetical protein
MQRAVARGRLIILYAKAIRTPQEPYGKRNSEHQLLPYKTNGYTEIRGHGTLD